MAKNKEPSIKEIRQYIEFYLQQGFCLIPVKYGDKAPMIKWEK